MIFSENRPILPYYRCIGSRARRLSLTLITLYSSFAGAFSFDQARNLLAIQNDAGRLIHLQGPDTNQHYVATWLDDRGNVTKWLIEEQEGQPYNIRRLQQSTQPRPQVYEPKSK